MSLHGAEVIRAGGTNKEIKQVSTAVIGVVGTANFSSVDSGDQTINKPVLLWSEADAVKYFGAEDGAASLPTSLKSIYGQFEKEIPLVIAVNVYDPAEHTNGVTDVVAADIIGEVTVEGKRTGIKALLDAKSIFGITPKIIGAPFFTSDAGVAQEIASVCSKVRGVGYIDSTKDMTVTEAISARDTSGQAFNISSKRVSCLYPMLKNTAGTLVPYSAFMLGLRAKVDMDKNMGYWWSASSKPIKKVIGSEVPVEYAINQASCEANMLNQKGIVTIKNVSGIRTNGNYNASYPTNTDSERFECVLRVGDVIEESIELYSEQRIDQPINNQFIDDIVNDVKNFLATLKGRGAILGGDCWYEAGDNNPADIAAGKIVFSFDDAATPPADNITYKRYKNLGYLKELGGK